ncbi:MAG: hypothetical protein Q8M55_02300, partial [Actinomycetota bacterium]|nr:hypothetical protein [Actinomycetota bacterium]
AAMRVAEELALESLFRARGFEVADTDLDEAILELVSGDEIQARQMRESLAANGALPILREQIMHRRALAWLMDNTVVTEEEPS